MQRGPHAFHRKEPYGCQLHRIFCRGVWAGCARCWQRLAPPRRSPIFGVTIPSEYRQWEIVAPSEETGALDELRVVLGNAATPKAYQDSTLPFPEGTVLAKLAWKRVQSPEFSPAYVPAAATTVQFMVKDSKKYASTGGWGFGRFIDGKPADEDQHRTCFGCHVANVKAHDFVFTRLGL